MEGEGPFEALEQAPYSKLPTCIARRLLSNLKRSLVPEDLFELFLSSL